MPDFERARGLFLIETFTNDRSSENEVTCEISCLSHVCIYYWPVCKIPIMYDFERTTGQFQL